MCVCVCVFRKSCLLSPPITTAGYVLCGWEGGKEGRDKKRPINLTKKTYWSWPFVVMICTPPVLV